jgi:hypothetical protein
VNQIIKPKKTAVTVYATANGYIVRPSGSLMQRDCYVDEDTYVFETFSALANHLRDSMPLFKPNVVTVTLTETGSPRRKARKTKS